MKRIGILDRIETHKIMGVPQIPTADGTGVGSENRTGVYPVQFFAEDERSEFNWGGSRWKNL